MNMYEIDRDILLLIDEETGEIADFERFEELQMERTKKIENMIRLHKQLSNLAEGISKEISELKVRKARVQRRADSLKEYVTRILDGADFTSPAGEVRYRKSCAVETDEEFIEWASDNAPHLLKITSEVALTAIREALERGDNVEHAAIVERNNTSIK